MVVITSLPWWAGLYLGIVFLMSAAGFMFSYQKDPAPALSDLLSTLCVFVFVMGYFHAPLALYFGWFLVPMVLMGIAWEYKRAIFETGLAERELEKEAELTENERRALINLAIALNGFVVVPGYVCGLVLCFNLMKSVLIG